MSDDQTTSDDVCLDCNGTGRIEGCGRCDTSRWGPCTTEGMVVCYHDCPTCDGGKRD